MSKYLRFVEMASSSGKTKRVEVYSIRTGETLATIAWFGRWRCYVFYPEDGTIWNNECLRDICLKLEELKSK